MNSVAKWICSTALIVSNVSVARAEFLGADQGKLLLTAGFSTLEGAGGGALTPFAMIAGYGSNRSWGANAFASDVMLRDVELRAFGAAIGAFDRFEISFAHQQLDVTNGPLEDLAVSMDVVGAKIRLFGNAVYGQGSWLPQVAVGAQYKSHGGIENFALTSVEQLGARDTDGIDYYLSATKISLANSFLVNVTVRATEANQLGLLGFGGNRDTRANPDKDQYRLRVEGTLAYLLTRRLAVGGEYRMKPRNLAVDDEEAAWDVFIAWAPTKYVSIVGAYADMGSLLTPVTSEDAAQNGGYLSIQVGF